MIHARGLLPRLAIAAIVACALAPAVPTLRAEAQATAPTKYFGADPWHAIEAAAAAAARTCTISDTTLTAMVVAPVFKESSSATTAAKAPSPMTLSRYDEWTGVMDTTTNANANYGLYAFRDPSTTYKRAYWHPGVGIWQYDTAGVGAPFTAIERMDVGTVSADIAKGMANRYCNPSPSLIGHSAPFSDQERRFAAWSPWGYPCTLCEQELQEMLGGETPFANIGLVSGISVTGGAQARTCSLVGVAGTLPCWFVDPSVGTIEGATGWATIAPVDGGSPTVAPAPLAKPFYVLKRNGREERHWLRGDTGYDIDISGTRELGKNDRPRSNQAGSGVTWQASSGLCDLTAARGTCGPLPPAGLTSTVLTIGGSSRPVALDADGDGNGDVLWYTPGPSADPLWLGHGSGAFTTVGVSISGSYDTVRPLDVDGDGDDDLLWYQPTTGASYLWRSNGDGTFVALKLAVGKQLVPLVVDRNGDGRDEVFWYGPGSIADAWWQWNGTGFTVTARPVSGTYRPFTGDFDGNGRDDIFWYAPGSTADAVWTHQGSGSVINVPATVSGSYQPLVGDFDGDRRDDIFWYAPGSAGDAVWWGAPRAAFTRVNASVSGTYQPVVVDLEGEGRGDIVWYAPGSARASWWRWSAGRTAASSGTDATGRHQPVVGGFSAGGADGIIWYAPGDASDSVWWH